MNGKGLGLIMQNSTKRMAALLLTLVVLLTGFTWPAEAARSYAGTMNRNNVALRSQASNRFTTLAKIDKGEKVTVYELKGNYYKVKYNGKTGYVLSKYVKVSTSAANALKKAETAAKKAAALKKATPTPKKTVKKATATPKKVTTKKATATPKPATKTLNLKWYNTGKNLFKRNSTFVIKDVKTGKKWNCKVLYGSAHLDAEPLTKADTNIMKAAYGGRITYKRRAVLVMYKNKVYAGSMYGVPHGEQTITNNGFNGQFCIHFTGSKTHGSNKVDADHQAAIQTALKASW